MALPATASAQSAPAPDATAGYPYSDVSRKVLDLFRALPGRVALRIVAPGTDGRPPLTISRAADDELFIGSAFKTFVLCEALRQSDPQTIVTRQLALNESVWSPDAPILNPPHLSGTVSERTALEAMIMHSDNTATDMMLKLVGPDNVRAFISSIGLERTRIPDSTRSFLGYLAGAKNYRTWTWDDWVAFQNDPTAKFVNSPLNPVETMQSTANELVTYYTGALQGRYLSDPARQRMLLETLSLGDAIWILPMPMGVSAFAKGGSIDVPGYHALCVPGGMYFDGRWVFFAMVINWYARAEQDLATVQAFAAAGSAALQLVKDALACG